MQKKYSFNKVINDNELSNFKKDWLKSLTRPQDGMWESFRESATHWEIRDEDKMIGYTCIDDNNQLLQFYLSPEYLSQGEIIFKKIIQQADIKTGIVGTNNLIFLSIALNFVKELEVHTCLFSNHFEANIAAKEGKLSTCKRKDIDQIVDFCHYALGADKEWLNGYIGSLIDRKEI